MQVVTKRDGLEQVSSQPYFYNSWFCIPSVTEFLIFMYVGMSGLGKIVVFILAFSLVCPSCLSRWFYSIKYI
ncbi:hypothetical protein QBC38DRAFT_476649 [Podospora fimiseda]|uniref:Uncharacterized protein n=1 Tax=Podospora fimiseda TaxID=252190 RepID=A0AAN7BR27_9PEZI|nr:hypothetical protein QBC38DRAFT_476649 [Podospora fimiseda]